MITLISVVHPKLMKHKHDIYIYILISLTEMFKVITILILVPRLYEDRLKITAPRAPNVVKMIRGTGDDQRILQRSWNSTAAPVVCYRYKCSVASFDITAKGTSVTDALHPVRHTAWELSQYIGILFYDLQGDGNSVHWRHRTTP